MKSLTQLTLTEIDARILRIIGQNEEYDVLLEEHDELIAIIARNELRDAIRRSIQALAMDEEKLAKK